MPAASWDINVEQGSAFQQLFDWEVDDVLIDVEAAGFTGRAQVRRRYADHAELALELDVELDGTDILVTASSADTEELDLGFGGVWDLELESEAGAVVRLVRGRAKFSREVTRNES